MTLGLGMTGAAVRFGASFNDLTLQQAPLIYLKYGVSSGNPNNFGTLAGLSITASGITYNGAGVAALPAPSFGYAATNSKVSIGNNAAFGTMQSFTYITIGVLSTLTAAGTRIWDYSDSTNHVFTIGANGDLNATIRRATTAATYVGTAGDITASTLPRMFALSFDINRLDAQGQPEPLMVFQCFNGIWQKYAPITQGSGAVSTMSSNLNFGNNQSNIRAWGGLRAADVVISGIGLSEYRLSQMAVAAGLK